MGKQSSKKKTRKDKTESPRLVACGKRIGGVEEIKLDYDALSSTGQAAAKRVAILVQRPVDYVLNPEVT